METPHGARHHRPVFTDPFERILGESRAAQAIRTFGRRAARVDAPVLLLGESGTGKGVLARAIHDASPRAKGPFVAVNCAAIPYALFESEFFGHVRGAFTGAQYAHKGLFEQAHGGTLFLDEVGELPVIAQAKLLTTIEDRIVRKVGAERTAEVNVRIVAATARALEQDIASGRFRTDLYHRLSVLSFEIPPLRDRRADIALIASHVLLEIASRYDRVVPALTPDALQSLEIYSWAGNVRELTNTLERALLSSGGETLTARCISFLGQPFQRKNSTSIVEGARYSFSGSREQEIQAIKCALAACHGNKSRAARMLGMSRNTLLNKMRHGSFHEPTRERAS